MILVLENVKNITNCIAVGADYSFIDSGTIKKQLIIIY